MKFYIETYGCTANQGNSDEFSAALIEKGHVPSELEDADLVIVNTCVVTERTERNMIKRLRQLQGDKLVIAGCLPTAIPEAVQNIRCRSIASILSRSVGLEMGASFSSEAGVKSAQVQSRCCVPNQPHDLCGAVNISEGCNGNCSYCIVKKARDRLKSRSPEEVVEAICHRLRSGSVEIQLASQDAASYGMDIGSSLPKLLDQILEVPGQYKIRIGMMNPTYLEPILDELVESYEDPRIYNFLHLPVQSGSDKVLDNMNRGYKAADFVEMVTRLREGIPNLTLFTDVIVGFPGETEKDFRETEELIRTVNPDKVNVTRFSSRPYTEASKLEDLPNQVKKARSKKLTLFWQEIAAQRNKQYIGKVLSALVTEKGKGDTVKARSDNYRQIVIRSQPAMGSFQNVRIIESNPFYLRATIQNR
ncbi:MAG: tRNA (N(6)-L-threonylcarbamoyladenosine(37)-C(2))-methylthiotransferase [Methanotrichaceae archaeon]